MVDGLPSMEALISSCRLIWVMLPRQQGSPRKEGMTQAGGQRHTLFHTVMMEQRSQRTRMARYKDMSHFVVHNKTD